ncbi:hypothetical protein ACD578_05345 [Microvirga sp. RSM25]|uniref:hypothetical protein n=1 Tax=Microvirga sp. RSM25 TaxID=3273802 RepID=UPI00384E2A7C
MSSGPVDPCAEAARLRELLTAIASGESVASARFGDEEIRYHKADPERLERMIAFHERECSLVQGQTPKRTRFAKRMGFRPY